MDLYRERGAQVNAKHVNFFELAATISPVLKIRGGAKGGTGIY